jgi:hypothetical protein
MKLSKNYLPILLRILVLAFLICHSPFLISHFSFLICTACAQAVPLDYSFCGYQCSEQPIPSAKVVAYVQPTGQDDAVLIQQAIDWVGSQKPDKQTGLRGAVLLGEGTFTISEPLRIHTSGVVLRGSGRKQTILRKTGYDRGALIYIEGTHNILVKDTFAVSDVMPGTLNLSFTTHHPSLQQGQRLAIWRPSTQEWIESLNCQSFGGGKRMGYWGWHPGEIDLFWHRVVKSVNGNQITLDAPITCSIEQRWGGAKAIVYENKGLISECGIENLSLESDFDHARPLDEDHCWDGIYVAEAENCWVRMVNFHHFAGSAVVIQKTAAQITVEDCQSLQPISEIGGYRRRTFLTFGEKTLFQRCYSEHGINDFAVGHTAAGPNAFVQCESFESFGPSGAISSWAPGILFDIVNVDGNDIVFKNWELEKFGAGWSTANSMLWQSTASGLFCYSPDSLNRNSSHGCWGQIQGSGEYSQMNEHVNPYSLFRSQLEKRLGRNVDAQCRVYNRPVNASSSPTIDEAIKLAEEALQPRVTMQMWIDSARFEGDITPIKPFAGKNSQASTTNSTYSIINGWLTKDGGVLVGHKHQTPWWNGKAIDASMAKAKPALTRFVPGQEETGGTDRIDSVIADMQRHHIVLFSQNYGLWTDRRRDDHERIRRKDGDAWAPFYEQPFARVGTLNIERSTLNGNTLTANHVQSSAFNVQRDLAWDGMSKYDLTSLNKWYFWRLQQFAKKTESIGILLKNQHYFQHNILEAGAHWADCPWRTANNVNNTPFTEPVNYTGDKRIFTAIQFYDITNPTLRELHRQYIRQTLDAFKGQPNVIHSIGEEFTGPLHFVQFWLDVIAEWELANGKVLVDLAVNKDVQDAILKDPKRSKIVDIIDIEQWFYHNKGEYAPPGGVNMAPRQYARKIRTGSTRFEDVYRAVSEYRLQYPDKAIVYFAQKAPEMSWASLMAGGSCTNISIKDEALLKAIATMQVDNSQAGKGIYRLYGSQDELIYNDTDNTLPVDKKLKVVKIDMRNGKLSPLKERGNLPGKGLFWLK